MALIYLKQTGVTLYQGVFNPDFWRALVVTEDFDDQKRGTLLSGYAGLSESGLKNVALFPFYLPDEGAKMDDFFVPDRSPDAALMVEFTHEMSFNQITSASHIHNVKSAALIVPRGMNPRDTERWISHAHHYFESLFGPRPDRPDEGMGVGVVPPPPTPVLLGAEKKEIPVIYIPVPQELPAVGVGVA